MSFLITLLALSVVIFIHELGHLIAAKWAGIAAPEFSIGMGPLVVKKHWRGTDYCLRLLPIGGFVKLGGLDDSVDAVPEHENYYFKPFFWRFLTIVAGSLMNLLLGCFLYMVVFLGLGKAVTEPVVYSVLKDSPAATAGLIAGDRLISINNHPIQDPKKDFVTYIRKATANQSFDVVFERNGEKKDVKLTPAISNGTPQVGIQMNSKIVRLSVVQALNEGGRETLNQIKTVFSSLKMLFTGQAGIKDLAGPVGILQFASFGFEKGAYDFLAIIAMISISLGVANLLPIPVLDGGHIVFLILEKIMGKRLPKKVEAFLFNAGAILLISLMVFIVGNDIFQWKNRISILKGFK